MYALKEKFEVRIRRSSKTRYEAGCKDGECEFQLHAFKMQKGEYWVVRMFLKDHTCNIDGFPLTSSTSKFLDCRRTINTKVASTRALSKTQRHHGRNVSGTWTSFLVYKGLVYA
ncbi:hypothetical protein Dsin_009252 [Dipteronia sinensis]|uniref:Transposase MuDR plant domain-containing protein n=1 Tax=Dipteronia sinensis TaxID=43782 RepID=A0AAE0AQM8_9ROSI|nr:hypothetical protein Dsin_009252 [Dipteronia sinensis]